MKRFLAPIMAVVTLGACATAPDVPGGPAKPTPAASVVWGTVTGTVRDTAGRPAPGVLVVAAGADASAPPVGEKAISTDDAGRYRWQLMPGRYTMTAHRDDRASTRVTVTVTAGRQTYADLTIS